MKVLLENLIYTRIFVVLMIALLFRPATARAGSRDTVTVNRQSYVRVSDTTILFHFWDKRKMFFMDYKHNRKSIQVARKMIRHYFPRIKSGEILVSVNGYCSSYPTERGNLLTAKNRSNQVKSYFITHDSMKERFYRTTNHTASYNGDPNVVAMLEMVRVENKPATTRDTTKADTASHEPNPDVQDITAEKLPDSFVQTARPMHAVPESHPSQWTLKTNFAGWAFVVPNIGLERKFAGNWSIDIPIYYMPATVARTYRFRVLALQPSLRYWLGKDWHGHFFGIHLTGGQFNVSTKKDYRYQDHSGMWGAGLDYGYAFSLSKRWGLELNVGAGMIYTKYNTYYNVPNGAFRSRQAETYWGVTRCGLSLLYELNKW